MISESKTQEVSKNEKTVCNAWPFWGWVLDCYFKSTQQLNRGILDLSNKFTISLGYRLDNRKSIPWSEFGFPPSIVPANHLFIAHLNNQSTIFMLNKIDQEQPKNPDKQMLFFHVSDCYLRWKKSEGYANRLEKSGILKSYLCCR